MWEVLLTNERKSKGKSKFPPVDVIGDRLKAVVLKVVDIDPQGSIEPSKGSINSHGVEWGR